MPVIAQTSGSHDGFTHFCTRFFSSITLRLAGRCEGWPAMSTLIAVLATLAVLFFVLGAAMSVRIVKQYEKWRAVPAGSRGGGNADRVCG